MSAVSTQTVEIVAGDAGHPDHIEQMTDLWNAAAQEDLAISSRFVAYNLRSPAGGTVQSWLAIADERPVGFVIASHLQDRPTVVLPTQGWIGAIAVQPEAQLRGVGAQLLHTAEAWLQQRGVTQIMLGGDLRPFMPGVPVGLHSTAFFTRMGYGPSVNGDRDGVVWDVACDLSTYTPPESVVEVAGVVRPAQPGDEQRLLGFLQREFPGRWHYEAQEFLREGGRLSDWMLLWTENGVEGFCVLTFEDSRRPIERYYPYTLPRPWGQLGPIGISSSLRGQGFGAAVLDAGLRRLHNNGIKGCIIDWTTLVDFYAKFGFEPYHAFQQMGRAI
jgi:GNAT superfamily N-acetyltransferase